MKQVFSLVYFCSVSFSLMPLFAAEGSGPEQTSGQSVQQSAHRKRMISLMEEFRDAKTDEDRKRIHAQMRNAREAYRAANPPKQLTPAEVDAQRRKLEEMLRKDPFRWEMYQLRQSMASAKTQEERESYQGKIQALVSRHAAEKEAKLTPEQRAVAKERQAKNEQLQAELKPLMEQLHSSNSIEGRKAVRAQMREIFKKYHKTESIQ